MNLHYLIEDGYQRICFVTTAHGEFGVFGPLQGSCVGIVFSGLSAASGNLEVASQFTLDQVVASSPKIGTIAMGIQKVIARYDLGADGVFRRIAEDETPTQECAA